MTHYSQPVTSARGKELRQRILQNHLSYLGQDETPAKLEQRRNLEGLIAEFLSSVPHNQKFIHTEITDILNRSVVNIPDFSAYKAGAAFQALEKYATNLLGHPWRKEYRVIRVYGGFYSHSVRSHLVESERVLHLLGYTPHGDGILMLEGPVDPDRVTRVSLDCIAAYVECQIMVQICEKLESFTWQDIARVRQSYPCGPDEAVQILQQLQQSQQKKQIHEPKPTPKLRDLYPQIENGSHLIGKDGMADVRHFDIHSPPDDLLPGSWSNSWRSPTSPQSGSRYLSNQPDGYPVRLAPLAHETSTRPGFPSGSSRPSVNGSQQPPRLTAEEFESQRANSYNLHTMNGSMAERSPQAYNGYKPPPPVVSNKEGAWDPLQDMYYQQDLIGETPAQSVYGCMPRGALAYHPFHPVGQYPSFHCYENPMGYIMPYKPDPMMHLPSSPCHCCHLQPMVPSMHCTRLDTANPNNCCTKSDNTFSQREQNLNALTALQMSLQQMNMVHSKPVHKSEQSYSDSSTAQSKQQQGVSSTKSSEHVVGSQRNSAPSSMKNGVGVIGRRSTSEKPARRSAQIRRESFYDNLSSSPEDERPPIFYSVPNENLSAKNDDIIDIDVHVPYNNTLSRKRSTKKSTSDNQPEKRDSVLKPVDITSASNNALKPESEPKIEISVSTAVPPPPPPLAKTDEVVNNKSKTNACAESTPLPLEPHPTEADQSESKQPSGKWPCSACTYLNDENSQICEMCSKSRRQGSECTPLVSGGRECPRCTLVNDKDTDRCTVCDASLRDCPTYI